jgi:hypothetical protein
MTSFLLGVLLSITSILHVAVLYDGDHDGITEGVGAGIPVWIGPNDHPTLNYTGPNSEAAFLVEPGIWYVRADVPPTRPFWEWVCLDFVPVDEDHEYVILYCIERFRVRVPFLTRP